MCDPLVVYCLPVSGGGFVAQLGLFCELYDAKYLKCGRHFRGQKDYQPDLVFAASGGNVATYVALAADWSTGGIKRIGSKIHTSMFIRSWFPKPLDDYVPTWMVGGFYGSIYRQGKGCEDFFNAVFNRVTIQRTEIWTGTYDHRHQRAQFFCNKGEGKTLIRGDTFRQSAKLYSCMPLRFLEGNLKKIAQAATASSAIPFVVPRQHIDDLSYVDGGSMYASPFTPMVSDVYRLITGISPDAEEPDLIIDAKGREVEPCPPRKRQLRLFYFCSYDMSMSKYALRANGVVQDIKQILHANVLQDRALAIELLFRVCGEDSGSIKEEQDVCMDTAKLARLLTRLEKYTHYVVVLYAHDAPQVKFQFITSEEILSKINTVQQAYGVHCWYYP